MTTEKESDMSMRSVRVPNELWAKLTAWAEASGVGDSEALRELLRLGTEQEPRVIYKPALKWMSQYRRTGLRNGCWIVGFVKPGPDWNYLDDVMGSFLGRTSVNGPGTQRWHAIPRRHSEAFQTLMSGRCDRVVAYMLDLDGA